MVIQAAIDQWLASEKGQCEESTHQTYRYTLSVFQTFLAQRQPAITAVHEITLPLLHAYIHYLQDTRRLADRTLHTYVHVVARWLTDLINDGDLTMRSERGNMLTPEGVRKRLQRKLPSLEPPVAPCIPDLRRLPVYYDELRTAFLHQRSGQVPPVTDIPGYRRCRPALIRCIGLAHCQRGCRGPGRPARTRGCRSVGSARSEKGVTAYLPAFLRARDVGSRRRFAEDIAGLRA